MGRWFFLILPCLMLPLGAQAALTPQGSCSFFMGEAPLGGTLPVEVTGPPSSGYAIVLDIAPGQITLPGFGTIHVGVTPALTVIFDAITGTAPPLDATGHLAIALPVPLAPSIDGLLFYGQALVQDPTSSSGFCLTVGQSVQFAAQDGYKPALSTMAEPRSFHRTVPLPNGALLVIGGGSGDFLQPTASANCERFNPFTRTFLADAPMATPRTLHTATALPDGRIFVAGGSLTLGGGIASTELYDPVTQTFTPGPTMALPRIAHTATLLANGRVLLTGGSTTFVLSTPTSTNYLPIFNGAVSTAEVFDPVSNTLTPTGNTMSSARLGHAAQLLPSGRVLVVGGIRAGQTVLGASAPLYAQTSDIYDPVTNTFVSAANLTIPRVVHTLDRLPNGDVVALGGAGGTFVVSVGSSEIFNETSMTWSAGPSLPGTETVGLHAVVPLDDGSLYVCGGAIGALGAFQGVSRAYRLDPVTLTLNPLNPLPAPRQAATAVKTPHGIVIVGGADAGNPIAMPPINPTPLDTALLYTR